MSVCLLDIKVHMSAVGVRPQGRKNSCTDHDMFEVAGTEAWHRWDED